MRPGLLLAVAVALALALVWSLGAPAHAQPRGRSTDEGLREARDHFDRGMQHYTLGDFDLAIAEFKLAYERSDAPGLLFNIAQAYRLKKDPERAIYFYRTFLRLDPNAPNHADAEQRVAELEPLVKPNAPLSVTPSPAAPMLAASSDRHPGNLLVISGAVVMAGGVALVLAGVGLGVDARNTSDDLTRLAAQKGAWTSQSLASYRAGEREAISATVLDVIGGIAAGSGLLVTLLGVRANRIARRVAVAPAPGGARLTANWSF